MNRISFMGANLVAQQLDWRMTEGWAQGDRAANEWYRPLATFEERFDAFVGGAVELGFDTVDVWHPMLSFEWATDAHVDAARRVIARHGVVVASYGSNYGDTVEKFRRANEIAAALGTRILGGQTPLLFTDRDAVIATLVHHHVRPRRHVAVHAARAVRALDMEMMLWGIERQPVMALRAQRVPFLA